LCDALVGGMKCLEHAFAKRWWYEHTIVVKDYSIKCRKAIAELVVLTEVGG